MHLLRVLLMLVLSLPSRAGAVERPDTVLLSVAASAEESARLEAVTRDLLLPLRVQLEVRRVPRVDVAELRRTPPGAYFARAWVALSLAGSARLYLEHGESDRLLVRDVPGDPSNPELLREELGHILQAAVEGLKAGEQVGEPRQEALQQVAAEEPPVAATPAPARPPPPAPRAPTPWRVGARYEARWLGDAARFEDGPGVVCALVTPLGFELGAYYRRPLRVEREPLGVRLETASLRALLTFEALRSLRLGAGLGADFARVSPLVGAEGSVDPAESAWLRLAFGRLQATFGRRAFSRVDLQVSAGADADLSGTRYVLQRSAGDTTVLEPFPLRPFLSLGAVLP